MILFGKKYHTFSGKVSYIFKKVSYFWLNARGEGAEGVGEDTKEERFWHRTRGSGAAVFPYFNILHLTADKKNATMQVSLSHRRLRIMKTPVFTRACAILAIGAGVIFAAKAEGIWVNKGFDQKSIMEKLLSKEKFYLFGMGNRPKLIWKNHCLFELKTGRVLACFGEIPA